MLEGSTFSYYDRENASKPIRRMLLHSSDTIQEFKMEKGSGQYLPKTEWTFHLLTHRRVLDMCAESEVDRLSWVNAIRAQIKQAQDYTLAERS